MEEFRGGIKSSKTRHVGQLRRVLHNSKMGGLTSFFGGGVQNPSNDHLRSNPKLHSFSSELIYTGIFNNSPRSLLLRRRRVNFLNFTPRRRKDQWAPLQRLPVFSHHIMTSHVNGMRQPSDKKGFMAGKLLSPSRNKVSRVGLQLH